MGTDVFSLPNSAWFQAPERVDNLWLWKALKRDLGAAQKIPACSPQNHTKCLTLAENCWFGGSTSLLIQQLKFPSDVY